MKSIKIVRGTYGLAKENSFGVSTKSRTDPPFEVNDDEAKRLVDLGVAEYATGETPVANTVSSSSSAVNSSGGGSNAGSGLTLAALRKSNKTALEKIAAKRGVDISGATNNVQRADLIWADIEARAAGSTGQEDGTDDDVYDDEIDDGDIPPVLGADEPVD